MKQKIAWPEQFNLTRLPDKSGYIHAMSGKYYRGITSFLKKFPSDPEPLLRWALGNYQSFDDYRHGLNRLAENGTALHDECEKALLGEARPKHQNLIAFMRDHPSMRVIATEQPVCENACGLAGTFDAFVQMPDGRRVVIDWKSSKRVQPKHLVQASFYGTCLKADEAWVVALGGRSYEIGRIEPKRGFGMICALDVFYEEYGRAFPVAGKR